MLMQTDVLIVGYGCAGMAAAYYCNKNNIKHLVIEKNSHLGGLSIISDGGIAISFDPKETAKYLTITNDNRHTTEYTDLFSQKMYELRDDLKQISIEAGVTYSEDKNSFHSDFDGCESLGVAYLNGIKNCTATDLNPDVVIKEYDKGWELIASLHKINSDYGTEIIYNCECLSIDNNKNIAHTSNGSINYKNIIFASGGFEASAELKNENWNLGNILHNGYFKNTGDGIRILNQIGAKNWNMWHFHGSYGFKHPEGGIGIRLGGMTGYTPNKKDTMKPGKPFTHIIVNQLGKRFMNEYHPFPSDTMHRPFEHTDILSKNFQTPSYFISDEKGREQAAPWGTIRANAKIKYKVWSKNNIEEIKKGLIKRARNVTELAKFIGCDENVLQNTLNKWNQSVDDGNDDLGRPKHSLRKLSPWYFVAEVYPMIGNTHGGPKHNINSQVLDSFDQPINNVYAIGELGAWWSWIYLASGNFSECFIGAKQAIMHIKKSYNS